VPPGWVECDGAALSRAGIGLDLFNKIGTTWGSGNGSTTFNVPDAKTAGRFLRSRSGSVALATAQSDQNKAHTHGVSITSGNQSADHTHGVNAISNSNGDHSHTISITDPGHLHTTGTGGNSGLVASVGSASSGSGPQYVNNGTLSTNSNTTGISASSDTTGAHTHTINVTSATTSADHTHLVSGNTNSDGGTEARPTNLSAILCIRL
jgi:microcystin-dependent protein